MLIEPVFISRREECLPNKLVSIYQKVSPLQTIEEKALSQQPSPPAEVAGVFPHTAEGKQFVR